MQNNSNHHFAFLHASMPSETKLVMPMTNRRIDDLKKLTFSAFYGSPHPYQHKNYYK